MKILLVAINAKYIHSNLAVYDLLAYAKEYREHIELAEYTINHRTDGILREIYKKKPDVLCFSCYIWNICQVCELAAELHKLLPELPIWVGGPEVSYECETFLKEHPEVTGIMRGEGEATFLELCRYYRNCKQYGIFPKPDGDHAAEGTDGRECLSQIRGLVYRDGQGEIRITPERPLLSMDEIPFCYETLEGLEHKILYYESSRGCPFRCSYCLSSLEKGLRFRSLGLVYRELRFFLEQRVPQVKFVDRTFNCDREHSMAIWRYLKEHDNGVTNFHFEISADLLTEEEIHLIRTMRPGLIQLEIGVQSTNPETIGEIRRTMDIKRLTRAVLAVMETGKVHQHLDLIAGLPFEDYERFQRSFDEIYALHPQQLQLGFLKVLKGSYLYENRKEYGILCQQKPPYEVLATRWLSFDELIEIKQAEEMLEVYYNSRQFELSIQILEQAFLSPFEMFRRLGNYYEIHGLFERQHSRIRRSEILLEFVREQDPEHLFLYQESLTFDLYYRENMKSRPPWAPEPGLFREEARRLGRESRSCHLEPFYHDFTGMLAGRQRGYPPRHNHWIFYCFSYEQRDLLTGQARVWPVV